MYTFEFFFFLNANLQRQGPLLSSHKVSLFQGRKSCAVSQGYQDSVVSKTTLKAYRPKHTHVQIVLHVRIYITIFSKEPN